MSMITIIVLFGVGSLVAAPPGGDRVVSAPAAVTTSTGTNDPGAMSPDDILRELKSQRPSNDVIAPASSMDTTSQLPPKSLLPEGWFLVNERGRLVRVQDDWALELERSDVDKAHATVRMLPSATLELMIRANAGDAAVETFVVSGLVTTYYGENFLLPRVAMRANTRTSTPSSAAPSPPVAPASADNAPVEDVLASLKAAKPDEQALPPPPLEKLVIQRPTNDSERRAALLSEGSPMIDRAGRLVRAGSWWTFVPETRSAELGEQPLKILPSKCAELMTQAVARDPTGLVFVVSGEATLFNGENFLFAKSVMRRVDTGNLGR